MRPHLVVIPPRLLDTDARTDQCYVIVRGKGRVKVGDLPPAVVSESDVVRIPANTPQRITNVGDVDPFSSPCALRGSCRVRISLTAPKGDRCISQGDHCTRDGYNCIQRGDRATMEGDH